LKEEMVRFLFPLLVSILVGSCAKKEQGLQTDSNMIDASILKVSKIEAKIITSPKRKVSFTLKKSPAAMYSQFVICTVTKPVRCNPSEKAPGIARTDEYEFLSPPPGDLEIKARACVEGPYAQNPDKLCGKWRRSSIGSAQSLM
jgi:hypothetical protein